MTSPSVRGLATGVIGLVVAWVVVSVGAAMSASATDPNPYGFSGKYADARGLVDFGQRWYDPRHQVFYAADQAPIDDPAVFGADARLTSSYSLNHHNSLVYRDPDGRMPGKITAPAIEADPEAVPYHGPHDLPLGADGGNSSNSSNSSAVWDASGTEPTWAGTWAAVDQGDGRDPGPLPGWSKLGWFTECMECDSNAALDDDNPPPWWWTWSFDDWLEVSTDPRYERFEAALQNRAERLLESARLYGAEPWEAIAWVQGLSVEQRRTLLEEAEFGFHGEYVVAERGLVDLGQRWYDPRHQVFYSADPAPLDDPGNLVRDPRLTSGYAFNHANALSFADPDGRMPKRVIDQPKDGQPRTRAATSTTGTTGVAPGVMDTAPDLEDAMVDEDLRGVGNSSNSSNSISATAPGSVTAPDLSARELLWADATMADLIWMEEVVRGAWDGDDPESVPWWWVKSAQEWQSTRTMRVAGTMTGSWDHVVEVASSTLRGARLEGWHAQNTVWTLRTKTSAEIARLMLLPFTHVDQDPYGFGE